MRRNRREELFIDDSIAHHANGRGRCTLWMGCQNHAHQRAAGGERNIQAIEEIPAGARFRMDSLLKPTPLSVGNKQDTQRTY
jgi:hypothetical protein